MSKGPVFAGNTARCRPARAVAGGGASLAGPSACQGPFASGSCRHSVPGPTFPARKPDKEGSGKGTPGAPRVRPGHSSGPRQPEPHGSDLRVTWAPPCGSSRRCEGLAALGSVLQSRLCLCHCGHSARSRLVVRVVLQPGGRGWVAWSAPSGPQATRPQPRDPESACGRVRMHRPAGRGQRGPLPPRSPAGLG